MAKVVERVVAGTVALAVSSVSNALLMAVVLTRFILMTILRSTSTAVEFAGETFLNVISFVRDTVFAVLTFVVQTATNTAIFLLNQLVSVWRTVVMVVSVLLGETCFLTKTMFKRTVDIGKDLALSLQAYATGFKGMLKVVKAQKADFETGVDVKSIVKQSVSAFKASLSYVILGDEGNLMDGLVPNVLQEAFAVLPLSVDLAKTLFFGIFEVSKETLGTSLQLVKELVSLKGIKMGCMGKIG